MFFRNCASSILSNLFILVLLVSSCDTCYRQRFALNKFFVTSKDLVDSCASLPVLLLYANAESPHDFRSTILQGLSYLENPAASCTVDGQVGPPKKTRSGPMSRYQARRVADELQHPSLPSRR